MKARTHMDVAAGLRMAAARLVGGVFPFVRNARMVEQLSGELATALLALERQHEAARKVHGAAYSSKWELSWKGQAHPHPELAALYDATTHALGALRAAELEVEAKAGLCSPPDLRVIDGHVYPR